MGVISGLLGIGGGFLFVPLLLAMGVNIKKAAATSSLIVVAASLSGFIGHAGRMEVDAVLIAGSSASVLIASQLGARLMVHNMNGLWLKRLFGTVLIVTAIQLLTGHTVTK